MDLASSPIRSTFFKYLGAAFGSALIASIYALVDMAMVGQYHGPNGTGAMSVVMPIYNIIYSLGLFSGIGGSVLFSEARGKKNGRENEYFSLSLWCTIAFSLAAWIAVFALEEPLLYLFGADEVLLPLTKRYLLPVKIAVPVFVFNQMLAAFLRNDGAPMLATIAVLGGGAFNVVGDYIFVFTLDMGIFGAGLATSIGAGLTLICLLAHFFTKKNTLKVVRTQHSLRETGRLLATGFATFFVDLAMGILTMLFNRQIMRYLGRDALSVYGVVMMISQFVQCCSYSLGQAAQPILSVNYGAGEGGRVRATLKYALLVVAGFGIFWTALVLAIPNAFIRIFMSPSQNVLAIAPKIMRVYGLSFLLLPFNIFSAYYFQSIMRPKTAIFTSVLRGMVVSAVLIYTLPLIAGSAIFYAMPITELLVGVIAAVMMLCFGRDGGSRARALRTAQG